MNDIAEFLASREEAVAAMQQDTALQACGQQFLYHATQHRYTHNFDWLGLPIIQLPQDILALQDIIWRTRPDIIIETGIARGGSLIFSASMLQLLGGDGKVIGVDVDIRPHNRAQIQQHPLGARCCLIEGSSISQSTLDQVIDQLSPTYRVMVILDSDHTHEHVLTELRCYSRLVTPGCYCVVMDTAIDELPDECFPNRPWGKQNNPKTAVETFLSEVENFALDTAIPAKLQLTVARHGYLKCLV